MKNYFEINLVRKTSWVKLWSNKSSLSRIDYYTSLLNDRKNNAILSSVHKFCVVRFASRPARR
jgi:hypothetical protein